jgi:hypothetical protein
MSAAIGLIHGGDRPSLPALTYPVAFLRRAPTPDQLTGCTANGIIHDVVIGSVQKVILFEPAGLLCFARDDG